MDGNESISMTRILFVCHGNICRSPMAESVFAAKVRERRLEWAYTADSAAVSAEEIGNPVHPGTQRELARHGLPRSGHRAWQLGKVDYDRYDLFIGMDRENLRRMERIFGSRVTPYHSKLTNRRRTETYLRLNRSQGGEFVVGVRSSIFLPLKRLQLVVVDEEHDASYKQADPAPRYNARDCAVVMARLWGGRTLLGSATPSLETWVNAGSGKYGLASLTERYGDARPPEIFVSDTIRAAKRGERHAHFNKLLLDKMEAALGRGEQVMLFQNRRGFAPYVECSECGWTARCPHCNVTLTYHKGGGKLVCHYCGYTAPVPVKCPSCKVTDVVPRGFGTEKVEEEIARLFPAARVARLDRDSVTSERAFNAIIADFEARKTDILVGTQMITKGFDFGGVSLVGILNADNLLNNPDFRAAERAFQLMMQVAAVRTAGRW